jgi:hypothetical protein
MVKKGAMGMIWILFRYMDSQFESLYPIPIEVAANTVSTLQLDGVDLSAVIDNSIIGPRAPPVFAGRREEFGHACPLKASSGLRPRENTRRSAAATAFFAAGSLEICLNCPRMLLN